MNDKEITNLSGILKYNKSNEKKVENEMNLNLFLKDYENQRKSLLSNNNQIQIYNKTIQWYLDNPYLTDDSLSNVKKLDDLINFKYFKFIINSSVLHIMSIGCYLYFRKRDIKNFGNVVFFYSFISISLLILFTINDRRCQYLNDEVSKDDSLKKYLYIQYI